MTTKGAKDNLTTIQNRRGKKIKPEVILIYPNTGWDISKTSISLPLSLLYSAIYLHEKANVKIIDMRINDSWKDDLISSISPNLLFCGISSMTGRQIKWGIEAAKIIREHSDCKIIWGGVHPSLLPEETLKSPYVDMVAMGEGEEILPEIYGLMKSGSCDEESLKGVRGIGYKANGEIFVNQRRDFLDMNSLPIPPYHLVDVKKYITRRGIGEEDLIIQTSRGCPHRCAYCYNFGFNGKSWRAQKPGKVLEHITHIVENFGVKGIFFEEDCFFVDKKRALEIAVGIKKKWGDLSIRAEIRADYVEKFGKDFFIEMRKAGFKNLYIGVESGSPPILERIKKDITQGNVLTANRILKECNIMPKFSFMAGFPFEKMEDTRTTLKFMERLVSENRLAETTFLQLYSPFPGTALIKECEEKGFKKPIALEEWANFDYSSARHMEWFSEGEKKILEKACLLSHFINHKNLSKFTGRNIFLKMAVLIYSLIIRLRIRTDSYAFMPELFIIKYLKRKTING